MPVTIHVNGAANSLVHKGSNGIAMCTIPDVCKTPSPGGPVPIPYPNIAMSSSLAKGTKTIKVDGKKMAAVKGSEFSRSNGDEAGTAMGVKSSTNMKEATWILYSFDVKLDGKNACRLADKMQMNHGNTVCLAGVLQVPVGALEVDLQKVATQCNEKIENEVKEGRKTKSGKQPSCAAKGNWKHKCCKDELEGKHENVKCEFTHDDVPNCRLDVAVLDSEGNVSKIYDFKFNCSGEPKMSRRQEDKYLDEFGEDVQIILVGAK